jgi:hypothetical protein
MTDQEIKTEVQSDVVECLPMVNGIDKTMQENYDALKAIVVALDQDFEKFQDKKVKAAGGRVRNNLLNCKKLCDKLRKQVLADIKILPIKHRKLNDEEGKDYENPTPSPTVSEDELVDLETPVLERENTEMPPLVPVRLRQTIDKQLDLEKVKKPRKPRKPRKTNKKKVQT